MGTNALQIATFSNVYDLGYSVAVSNAHAVTYGDINYERTYFTGNTSSLSITSTPVSLTSSYMYILHVGSFEVDDYAPLYNATWSFPETSIRLASAYSTASLSSNVSVDIWFIDNGVTVTTGKISRNAILPTADYVHGTGAVSLTSSSSTRTGSIGAANNKQLSLIGTVNVYAVFNFHNLGTVYFTPTVTLPSVSYTLTYPSEKCIKYRDVPARSKDFTITVSENIGGSAATDTVTVKKMCNSTTVATVLNWSCGRISDSSSKTFTLTGTNGSDASYDGASNYSLKIFVGTLSGTRAWRYRWIFTDGSTTGWQHYSSGASSMNAHLSGTSLPYIMRNYKGIEINIYNN